MISNPPLWKKNLLICCVASFIVSIGMSQMAPILPLYIAELGVKNPADVARWAGIVFGCNFISLAIFSPIWGRLSDRFGRKPMILRASGWLGLIMIGMGFAQNAGGANAANLYAMGGNSQSAPAQNAGNGAWNCACGKTGNTGKFCSECGKPRPDGAWFCTECGAKNTGKFCSECGKPRA